MCVTDLDPDLEIPDLEITEQEHQHEHEQAPGVAWGQAGKYAGVAWGYLDEAPENEDTAEEEAPADEAVTAR